MECICGSEKIITKNSGKYYITYCSHCGLSNYGINCSAIVSEETWKQKVEEIRKKHCDNCLFSTRKEKVDEAYQKGRADAIDEYNEAMHEALNNAKYGIISHKIFDDVAEQLKEQK